MKNPSGLCLCGCGRQTDLSPTGRRGYKRGEPLRYIRGHSTRAVGADYVLKDMDYETACWFWVKSVGSFGYGRVWNGSGHDMAHRVYYERFYGPIPEGYELHHLCGTPRCVNPEHLAAVTRKQHMATEGRLAYGNPQARVTA